MEENVETDDAVGENEEDGQKLGIVDPIINLWEELPLPVLHSIMSDIQPQLQIRQNQHEALTIIRTEESGDFLQRLRKGGFRVTSRFVFIVHEFHSDL